MEITYIHFISGQVLSLEHLDHTAMDNLYKKFILTDHLLLRIKIQEYAIALDKIEYITFPKSFTPTKD